MDYLLAIDGGSSKTELALTDTEGSVVRSVVIPKGTNPWKNKDFAIPQAVIEDGLAQLDLPKNIVSCAAGISGCHSESPFKARFEAILRPYVMPNAPILITGDILTSFRALSNTPSGMIAINGSGSSIALLFEDGSSYVYDGVGIAGRDIAISLILSAQNGYYTTHTTQWIESIIGEPVEGISISAAYHHPKIYLITKELSLLDAAHPIRIELAQYIHSVAVRWAVKIWGASMKYRTMTNLKPAAIVPVVLNGSVWQFDAIRNEVIKLLESTDEQFDILYDPKSRPISGVIRLAKDLL